MAVPHGGIPTESCATSGVRIPDPVKMDAGRGIRRTLLETPGVLGLHELRTRRMAHQALVDAHVLVDPRISVSEGHRMGERARQRVLEAHPEVADVLVHIDAEEDQALMSNSANLPDRDVLLAHLNRLLGEDAGGIEKTVLHYLGNRVEAEIFVPPQTCLDDARMARLEQHIAAQLDKDPYIRSISLNCRIAPK